MSNTNIYQKLRISNILGAGQAIDLLVSKYNPASQAVGFARITPAIAQKITEGKTNNQHYRNISKKKVEEYLQTMTEGAWSADFQISFVVLRGKEDEWYVANGNHRLTALSTVQRAYLEAQITIHYVDTQEELQKLVNGMDTGKGRDNADKLKIGGFDLPDLKLLGGCLGAMHYGLTFAQSKMEQTDINVSATYWSKPYQSYMNIISGDIPDLSHIGMTASDQNQMAAKLRTNVITSAGMITFDNEDSQLVKQAEIFWRGLRTLDSNGDSRLQLFINEARQCFQALETQKKRQNNPLRNERGRVQLFKQMCALWNDWSDGLNQPRKLASVSAKDPVKIQKTDLDGSVNKAWNRGWQPI